MGAELGITQPSPAHAGMPHYNLPKGYDTTTLNAVFGGNVITNNDLPVSSDLGFNAGDVIKAVEPDEVIDAEDILGITPDETKAKQILAKADLVLIRDRDPSRFITYKFKEGRYRIEGLKTSGSTGSLGEVWVGIDEKVDMNRAVAIKILNPDATSDGQLAETLLKAEKDALMALPSHPNVITLHDFTFAPNPQYKPGEKGSSEHPFMPVLVLEYVDGPSLDSVDVRSLDNEVKITILEDAAKAVDHIHKNNVIHRDLKPGQIMIPTNGKADWMNQFKFSVESQSTLRPQVKLIDFGLGRVVTDVHKHDTGDPISPSVEYLSPSVLANNPATKVDDLWSYAATSFYMFTGSCPYKSADIAPNTRPPTYIQRNLNSVLELNPNLDKRIAKDLDQLFVELFHKNGINSEKYNNASKIAAAIREIVTKKRFALGSFFRTD